MSASAPAPFESPSTREIALEEQPGAYVLRCKFNEHLHSQVLSSIACSSVALYGIRFYPDACGSTVDLIAVLSFAKPVDTDRSLACIEGDELVLFLPKAD